MKPTSFLLTFGFAFLTLTGAPAAQDAGEKPAPIPGPVPGVNLGLVGSSWLAEDIDKKGVMDNVKTFIRFDTAEKVTGSGGVNRFFGSCKLVGNQLSFGPLASTRKGGPPAMMDQEQRFLRTLEKVRSFQLDETGILHFLDEKGEEILRLSRTDAK